MSVTGISSSDPFQINQLKSELQQVGQDIQSGNVLQAQQDGRTARSGMAKKRKALWLTASPKERISLLRRLSFWVLVYLSRFKVWVLGWP